ncbi:MAG: hypothetical protein BGN88_00800 [Clostridiales bacterium 43-6]|nr:MAG: hypothetical protein BGN88_00800 [Clostridiales bacterium 43-6]
MDAIELTRQVGKAIQEDPRYIGYNLARETNDSDKELQDLIGQFNLQKLALNEEIGKENKDEAKVKAFDTQLRETYSKIMNNENMVRFNKAKTELDELVSNVYGIISMTMEGQDPLTCDPTACGGSCDSCGGGCH